MISSGGDGQREGAVVAVTGRGREETGHRQRKGGGGGDRQRKETVSATDRGKDEAVAVTGRVVSRPPLGIDAGWRPSRRPRVGGGQRWRPAGRLG